MSQAKIFTDVSVWRKWVVQYIVALLLVIAAALGCDFFQPWIDYRITALVLLLCVSLCSFFMGILPLLLLSLSSGLMLNYFFIPPIHTLHIDNAEGSLLFFMYLIVALLHGVFSTRIRAAEAKSRDKEEKEKSIQLYNAVLNSLSHEMRTPLATLIGAADTLHENGEVLNEEDRRRLYEVITESGLRLNRQVENLLNMSRMEAGMLGLKQDWCDVNELIQTCLDKYVPPDKLKRVHFEPDPLLPYFLLDAGLIEQVLANLLHNALQYAGEKAQIGVTIKAADAGLELAVSDDGPGLGSSELDRIFDKFYRVPGNPSAGTGLGLSIARGIAEAHGGNLQVLAKKPRGLVFMLKVPAQSSHVNKLKHE